MSDSNQNVIYGINGPVVTIRGATTLRMMEMVYVGNARLVGEVIGLDADQTTIQVYEETTGTDPRRTGGFHRRPDERHPRPGHHPEHI